MRASEPTEPGSAGPRRAALGAIHSFDGRERLADALARTVAAALGEAIERRGHALLAVSGGSTPKRFFARLAAEPLAWERVTVCLVDERFVPPRHARSNQKLVEEHLLKGPARAAQFVPLYVDAGSAKAAACHADAVIAALPLPFDAVVLGMGTDGHTASFFPGGSRLAEAIDPDGARHVLWMEAAGAGEPRLTLTMPVIVDAGLLVLHIEGSDKKSALEAACAPGRADAMPVRAVIDAAGARLQIFWAA